MRLIMLSCRIVMAADRGGSTNKSRSRAICLQLKPLEILAHVSPTTGSWKSSRPNVSQVARLQFSTIVWQHVSLAYYYELAKIMRDGGGGFVPGKQEWSAIRKGSQG